MVFAVKKGTDSTLLWKATVRVACVKVDATTRDIESYRWVLFSDSSHSGKKLI